jgi:hypothetical protein
MMQRKKGKKEIFSTHNSEAVLEEIIIHGSVKGKNGTTNNTLV